MTTRTKQVEVSEYDKPEHSIEIRDGRVYIASRATGLEPTVNIQYYDTGMSAFDLRYYYGEEDFPRLSGLAVVRAVWCSEYEWVYVPIGLTSDDRLFNLRLAIKGGGSALSSFFENVPVSAPIMRKGQEVRWQWGYWRRYIPSKGYSEKYAPHLGGINWTKIY